MKAVQSPSRLRGFFAGVFPSRPLRPSFAAFAVKGSSVDPFSVDAKFVSRTPRPWL
jgi:hypothetical protein